ncbi:MAG: FKBP-type peptidyl-prolyl cis-trans isomerase SlyD (EC [uncultured Sulfurovum sp.]|uniref:Peptidyl-prolyl cis-trans isomerase n=1 Tax=uncultured Sulfurovum sp. TaxID=269237 RepID=A0A6S6SG65_9BACT|nr:MAG: FKBP-type peptidyl-prolyl cis-trans isomerase SlyD (EC [uncultured Sulfurovum sp.]
MTVTNENCVVGIEYEVKEAGTTEVVDSNKGSGQPLEFIMGKGQVIPGLEKGLCGMGKDESADLMIPAADAYGTYNEEAIQTLPIDQFEGVELKEGLTLYGQSEDGQTTQVIVKSFTETDVEIDFNHPMAGKDLMFSVTVKDAREATAAEVEAGVVGAGEEATTGGSCGTGCGCH